MVSSDDKKLANAVGGKTARACDNCIKKRARWYCPADDAFLCQSCDGSVHSANPLARRHERVRLKICNSSIKEKIASLENISVPPPSWHRGVTKKARTPRQGGRHAKSESKSRNPHHHLVPEVCSDENSHEEIDDHEQLIVYRVPVFDPYIHHHRDDDESNNKGGVMTNDDYDDDCIINGGSSLPSEMEMELAEFAADVESLLGKGLEEVESFDMMEGLGLSDYNCKEKEELMISLGGINGKVKVEKEEEEEEEVMELASTMKHHHHDDEVIGIDLGRETFEINFDYYDSPLTTSCDHQLEDNKPQIVVDQMETKSPNKNILLRLDYDAVIAAWDDQRSPWTNGERPQLDSKDSWPDYMVQFHFFYYILIRTNKYICEFFVIFLRFGFNKVEIVRLIAGILWNSCTVR